MSDTHLDPPSPRDASASALPSVALCLDGTTLGSRGRKPARTAGTRAGFRPRLPRVVPSALAAAACLAGTLLAGPARAADDPRRRIDEAIDALADDDFTTRERAVRTLWQFGDYSAPPAVRSAAAAALRDAADSGNPEMARRARNVLATLSIGVPPDTARDVLDQLDAYRNGDAEQKRAAIAELIRKEVPGARVLLKLSETEADPAMRKTLLTGLAFLARPTVASLAVDGDLGTAGRLLTAIAGEGEAPARDLAAFLLVAGGLDEAISEAQAKVGPATNPSASNPAATSPATAPAPRPATRPPLGRAAARLLAAADAGQAAGGDAMRLAYLLRAKGELSRAAAVADAAADVPLADALLADAGRYADLAKRLESRGVSDDSVEDLGYVTAYHRLAGEQADADRWAAKLVVKGMGGPTGKSGDEANAAEALLLNGYPTRAIDLLEAKGLRLTALEYAGPRFDFALAERLAEGAKADKTTELPRVMAKSAPLLHHAGRSGESADRLRKVAAGELGTVDLDVWQDLIEAGPVSGIPPAEVDGWLARAMTADDRRAGQTPDRLFLRARLNDPERALGWWVCLQDHRVGMPPADAIALVRRLDRGQVPAEELTTLVGETKRLAGTLPLAAQISRMALVADTLAEAGRAAEAVAAFEPLAAGSESAETLEKLGDLYAKAKRWEPAADAYARARKADPADAKPVALQAWCLGQLGRADEAKRLVELAHLMPLGDEAARNGLAAAFAAHGMPADARRERELTVRTGDVRTWAFSDSLRRLAAEVAKADPLAAAAMWERAFLSNLSTQTSFVDPTANLTIPVLIRRTKAIGQVKAGRYEDAVAAAGKCLDDYPADADSQIAIVRALDQAGRKADADAVYKKAFDRYESVRRQYPASGQANNLVAWTTACVRRDLDHALACGKKGVELEPGNTAILDTLSEVYFARGEYDQALKVNEQCRAAEPYGEHHKKNLARFTAAKEGKPVSDEPGGGDDD